MAYPQTEKPVRFSSLDLKMISGAMTLVIGRQNVGADSILRSYESTVALFPYEEKVIVSCLENDVKLNNE